MVVSMTCNCEIIEDTGGSESVGLEVGVVMRF